MNKAQTMILEEMFKNRCTIYQIKLSNCCDSKHESGFNKICCYVFKHYDEITEKRLIQIIGKIDEFYYYDDMFFVLLLEYSEFLKLYRVFIDKYRKLYIDNNDFSYYTLTDDEYWDF